MIVISFEIPSSGSEKITNHLSELGALSISLENAHSPELFEPKPNTTPLWDRTTLIAHFPDEYPIDLILQPLFGQYPGYHVSNIRDNDWENAWREHFKPMQFGEHLWVCPDGEIPPSDQAKTLWMVPGLAFGTGNHETTRLCLEWLDKHPPVDKTLLDFGCGSGILSLAALRLGAARVYAIDHDEQALISTQQNAKKNNLNNISLKTPNEPVDIILANILANTLCELEPIFKSHLKPQGELVLSGILQNQIEQLKTTYSTNQWTLKDQTILNEWVRLVFTKQ